MWIHMCSTPGISRTRVSSHWLNISNLWKLFGILHLGMIPIDSFALIGWIWFKCPNCFHVFGMVPDMCLHKTSGEKSTENAFWFSYLSSHSRGQPQWSKENIPLHPKLRYSPFYPDYLGLIPTHTIIFWGHPQHFWTNQWVKSLFSTLAGWIISWHGDKPFNHIVKSRCLLVKSCKIQALLIKSF